MPQARKRSEITQAVVDWLADWQTPNFAKVLEDAYYGDPAIIPRTPCVSVDPGPFSRELVGANYVTQNEYTCILTVYHGREGNLSLANDRRKVDEFAEDVEDRLHSNRTMGDLVIHSFVNLVQPGYVAKGSDVVFIATQMQWYSITKTRLYP